VPARRLPAAADLAITVDGGATSVHPGDTKVVPSWITEPTPGDHTATDSDPWVH
jgi:hypothetical protein